MNPLLDDALHFGTDDNVPEFDAGYRVTRPTDSSFDVREPLPAALIATLDTPVLTRMRVRRMWALSTLKLGQWGASMRCEGLR